MSRSDRFVRPVDDVVDGAAPLPPKSPEPQVIAASSLSRSTLDALFDRPRELDVEDIRDALLTSVREVARPDELVYSGPIVDDDGASKLIVYLQQRGQRVGALLDLTVGSTEMIARVGPASSYQTLVVLLALCMGFLNSSALLGLMWLSFGEWVGNDVPILKIFVLWLALSLFAGLPLSYLCVRFNLGTPRRSKELARRLASTVDAWCSTQRDAEEPDDEWDAALDQELAAHES